MKKNDQVSSVKTFSSITNIDRISLILKPLQSSTGLGFSVETNIPAEFGNWFEAGQSLGFQEADPNAHLEQCNSHMK